MTRKRTIFALAALVLMQGAFTASRLSAGTRSRLDVAAAFSKGDMLTFCDENCSPCGNGNPICCDGLGTKGIHYYCYWH